MRSAIRLAFVAAMAMVMVAASSSCSSRWKPQSGGTDAAVVTPDAAGDATPALAACLDMPDELPRPPAGRLPCELIPPGLQL
jgi:hypothetical protein